MPADSWPRCCSAKRPKYVSRDDVAVWRVHAEDAAHAYAHLADLDEAAGAERSQRGPAAIARIAAPRRGSAGSSTSASAAAPRAASASACSSPP